VARTALVAAGLRCTAVLKYTGKTADEAHIPVSMRVELAHRWFAARCCAHAAEFAQQNADLHSNTTKSPVSAMERQGASVPLGKR
jgi:hypothetical protein